MQADAMAILRDYLLSDCDPFERYGALAMADIPDENAKKIYLELLDKRDPIFRPENHWHHMTYPEAFANLRIYVRPLVWADKPDSEVRKFLEDHYVDPEEYFWKMVREARLHQGYAGEEKEKD
jgi:hypothetical protein